MARELSVAEIATMKLLEVQVAVVGTLTKQVRQTGDRYYANYGMGGLREDVQKLLKAWEKMDLYREVLSKSGIAVGINADFTVEYRY